MIMRRAPLLLLPLLLCLIGCTADAGHGFASLQPGAISAELRPSPARDLGDDTILTDVGYHVQLARARLHVTRVTLLELAAGAGSGGTFDPAHPPPGFSLCHGGHCHAEDGSTPSYEEIQAMLAGGSASFSPIVTIPVDRELDLLTAGSADLDAFEPSAELPRAVIARLEVELARFEIAAVVSGGELEDEAELALTLPLTEPIAQTLSQTIDRDSPARLTPTVRLRIDGTLFDGLHFAALAAEGRVVIEPASTAAAVLIESLVTSELSIEF
jgi:hypothetical protein